MNLILLCLVLYGALATQAAIVEFYLYTKNDDGGNRVAINNPVSLAAADFNGNRTTYFLVHGWLGGRLAPLGAWMHSMRRALLNCEDANVFIADWGFTSFFFYSYAAYYTKTVGDRLADFVNFIEQSGGSRTRVHLIGHSLGGQVVGRAGRELNPKVARITGLDTAEVGFRLNDKDDSLDSTDAEFVDEIHTLVSKTPKGHADFYPNGGADPTPLKIWEHMEAPSFWERSVCSSNAFLALRCSNWASYVANTCSNNDSNRMGYYAIKPSTPTKYFLRV